MENRDRVAVLFRDFFDAFLVIGALIICAISLWTVLIFCPDVIGVLFPRYKTVGLAGFHEDKFVTILSKVNWCVIENVLVGYPSPDEGVFVVMPECPHVIYGKVYK